MANTNTNTTVSLHWNVATPALKLARVREQQIHNEQTDEVNDTDKATLQSETTYMSKTSKQRHIYDSVGRAGGKALSSILERVLLCSKMIKNNSKKKPITQQHQCYNTKQEMSIQAETVLFLPIIITLY